MARKKKRGVKPGTKRGPYKRKRRKVRIATPVEQAAVAMSAPKSLRSIADELDAALSNLEAKLQAVTNRINTILKV